MDRELLRRNATGAQQSLSVSRDDSAIFQFVPPAFADARLPRRMVAALQVVAFGCISLAMGRARRLPNAQQKIMVGPGMRALQRLNDPLAAFQTEKHTGSLGRNFSLVRVSNPRIRIMALKKAEQNDEIVLRLVEFDGQPQPVSPAPSAPPAKSTGRNSPSAPPM